MPYDLCETTSPPPAALVDKAESINKAETIDKTKEQSKDKVEEQLIDDLGSKTAAISKSPTDGTASEGGAPPPNGVSVDKDLNQLTTSETIPGEELDERMETGEETAASPPRAAPGKQRKTATSEQ